MRTWTHPQIGPIQPIVRRQQPKKVWSHFYDPAERWERVCDADPRELAAEAEQHGCPPFTASKRFPGVHWHVARLLQKHHDDAYAPAYFSEMAAPETRWAPKRADPTRWVARTPQAVVIFVSTESPPRVRTAYRPLAPGVNVGWGEADFQCQADYVFIKNTGAKETAMSSAWASRIADELQRCSADTLGSESEAWWLALAVGYGRLIGHRPEIAALLPGAERRLGELDPDLRARLVSSLELEGTLDRLAEAVKDGDPEPVEAALSSIEDLLVVAPVLGMEHRAAELLHQAEELLAWTPPELAHLARYAESRRRELGEADAPVVHLWSAVEEAVTGGMLRQAEPATRPAATVARGLVPAGSLLAERFRGLLQAGSATLRTWASDTLRGMTVRAPAPAMGVSADSSEPWELRGRRLPGVAWCRAFVVDRDHPDGYEVTDHLDADEAVLWLLDKPGDEAVVVLVGGDAPLPGSSLEELLQQTRERDDVVVADRLFSRPR